MKNKVIAVGFVALLTAGAIKAEIVSVVGNSKRAVDMVARDIADWHNMQHPSCKMKKAIAAAIQEHDSESSNELWTIEGCDGKKFQYSVLVLLAGGGFSTMVGNPDGSSMHVDGAPK